MNHSSAPSPPATGVAPLKATGPRSGLALLVLALAQAMLVLDLTVVNVALPVMSREVGLDPALAGWTIAAYAVPFGGLLLLGGRLADALGTRRMLLTGLAVFTVASLAAGLASDAAWLLAARAAQGVGAALLSPAALATLLHRFHGPARHRALAVWGAVGGAGFAVGVLLGGLLTGGPGWRWIFYINVPVGVLIALAVPVLAGPALARHRGRIDVLGAVLATAGVAALVASVSVLELVHPLFATVVALGGVALIVAFVAVERRSAQPLVRLALLRSRSVAAGSLLMFAATGLLVGAFFMFSFELQLAARWNPIATGLAFLPISLGVIAGSHLAGRAVGPLGARRVAPIALVTAALGLAVAAAAVLSELGEATAIAAVSVGAVGLGAAFVSASTTALSDVTHDEAGAASGVLNSFHEIGSGVGVAAFAAVAASSVGVGFAIAAAVAVIVAVLAAALVPSGATGGAATFVH